MERRGQIRTNFGRVEGGVPESRSGLIIGDLQNEVFPQHSCVARCAVLYPPLLFSGENFCLALIMGEYYNSGQGLGFDRRAC